MKVGRFIKLLSFILTICMVFTVNYAGIAFAVADLQTPQPTTLVEEDNKPERTESLTEPYVSTDNEEYAEITGKREESTKHFLLESKRYEAVKYGIPVHYLDKGKYKDIDNSLVLETDDTGNSYYTNVANGFQAFFASLTSIGWSAGISKDGYEMKWALQGALTDIGAEQSTYLTRDAWNEMSKGDQRRNVPNIASLIRYPGVAANTSVEYQLVGDKIKENIVISVLPESNTIVQIISLKGLKLILQKNGTIVAVDANDPQKEVFYLPAPYAFDNKYDLTTKIAVTLEEKVATNGEVASLFDGAETTYQLTYAVDSEWLNNASYPITIDPTVTTSLNDSDILDTRLCESYPNNNYSQSYVTCTGYGSSSHTNYALVQFNNMPEIGPSYMVTYAGYRMKKIDATSVTSYVSVHEVTESWVLSTVTWANRPDFDSRVDDFKVVGNAGLTYYEWDITRIAKRWYTGTTQNGLLIKDMNTNGGYKTWYTANATYGQVPYCYFVYTNFSGLEGFWDYTSASLGRSGAANVNLYNGNLIYTHTDLSMNGNRLPVTISHVFNSTTKDDNDTTMLYGKGWRTNYDQRVTYVTIGTTNYYKYVDEDGTEHYFSLRDSEWKDESGLDTKLTIDNSVPTIIDKKGNKLVFYATNDANKPGFLNYIEDRNGNQQTLGYDTSHRLSQITDGAGRVVLLTRDGNDHLYKIRQEVSSGTYRDITFTYTSSRLTRILYPDGEYTDFAYDTNGNIDSITGIDSRVLDLEYLAEAPYRITSMDESTSTQEGAELSFEYGFNRTTLTDSEGRSTQYQFNDAGNTVCIIGPDGSAGYTGFGTTPTGGEMSKITSASKLQKFGKNYLLNHGMEVTNNWTLASGGGSTGTHTYDTGQKYLGARSIKLYKQTSTGWEVGYQTQTLPKGQTYTVSGYIKTASVTGAAYCKVTYYNSSSSTPVDAYSTVYSGTQDWTRYWVTFTIPSDAYSGSVNVQLALSDGTGTAYFDCIQMENGPIPNRYNIVDNADFDYVASGVPNNWTRGSNCGASDVVDTSSDTTNPTYMSDNRFQFVGSPTLAKYIEQTLYLSGNEGDCLVAGGWANGSSIPISGSVKYGISIWYDYISYTDEWIVMPFSTDAEVWQYMCNKAVAKHAYQNVKIRVEMNNNANYVDFDGIQVFKEEFGNSFSYDANGNLVSAIDAAKQNEQFQYTNNDLTKYVDPSSKEFSFTYDSYHNMQTATSAEGLVYTFSYDSYGNATASKVGNDTTYIRSTVTYDANGNYTDLATDPFGKNVNYSYNTYKGILTDVTDPYGNILVNTYDSDTDLLTGASMTVNSVTISNSYEYVNDRLEEVSHNAPNAGTVAYDLLYNSLGWSTGTNVGAQSIVSYSLQAKTGRLNSVTYGNGQTVSYTYDAYDRLLKVSQDSADLYLYEFDNSGNIGYIKDCVQGVEYWYEYDSLNRLGKTTRKDAAGINTAQTIFNSTNHITAFKETISGTSYETGYSYDDDGKPDITTFGTFSKTISYDSLLGRVSGFILKDGTNTIYSTTLGYANGDGTTSITSGRESSIANGSETLAYTYDDRGFITKVEKDTNNYSEYRYDGFGQLIRENFKWGASSYTKIFAYDVGGNIASKTEYAFVAGDGQVGTPMDMVDYTYDSTWSDKLASIDSNTITYDAIGNPLTYNGWTYSWTQGRKLQQVSNSSTMASYKYDANGMRTEKTVNGTTTKYNIVGERVTWQQTGSNNPIYFLYDAVGKLWGLKYTDGDVYFYVRNLQGDIIKVVNSAGLIVVEYAYDAWGNSISTTGSMATTLGVDNPFRYRGYLLDSETGYFFVVSRYYDPNIGRFLNADNVDLLDGGNDHILENNLFTYCFNNPVNMTDEAGCWPKWVTKIALGISAVLIGAAVVAATVASGGAAAAFIGAAVTGLKAALVSGAIGAAVGAGTSVVNHRITTGSWDGSGKAALNGAANGFTNGFMTGGIMAGASQVLSGGFKVAANLGAKTGRNGGLSIGSKIKILSPNHKDFFESGGTLLKIGSRARNVRLDVGGRSLLHLNAEFLRNLHIPIGTIGSGIYGGIQ